MARKNIFRILSGDGAVVVEKLVRKKTSIKAGFCDMHSRNNRECNSSHLIFAKTTRKY